MTKFALSHELSSLDTVKKLIEIYAELMNASEEDTVRLCVD